MRLSSLILGTIVAVAVVVIVLSVLDVSFHRSVTGQGAALYDPAKEITVRGVVQGVEEFDCPVSENELAGHLTLKTPDGVFQVHLAPTRILQGQKLSFAPGEALEVVGGRIRLAGKNGIIAREIIRGNESIIFRDPKGNLLLVQ